MQVTCGRRPAAHYPVPITRRPPSQQDTASQKGTRLVEAGGIVWRGHIHTVLLKPLRAALFGSPSNIHVGRWLIDMHIMLIRDCNKRTHWHQNEAVSVSHTLQPPTLIKTHYQEHLQIILMVKEKKNNFFIFHKLN